VLGWSGFSDCGYFFSFHGLKFVTHFLFNMYGNGRELAPFFLPIKLEVGVTLQLEIRLNGSDESDGVASFEAHPSRNNSRTA